MACVVMFVACSPSPSSPAGPSFTVNLVSLPTGAARLTFNGSTRLISAHVTVLGLTPLSAHAVRLMQGGCLDAQTSALVDFPDIVTDHAGVVIADLAAAHATPGGIPPRVRLQLYLLPESMLASASAAKSVPIGCADIAPDPKQPVNIIPQPGRRPIGTATFTWDSSTRTLVGHLRLFKLQPNSIHGVRVYRGSCSTEGTLLYEAGDVTSNGAGNVDARLTVKASAGPPPDGFWYLAVHLGSSADIMFSGQPTEEFQPILCGVIPRLTPTPSPSG